MSGIDGKVIAITGASSGIGEATARRLAAGGARVVLAARRRQRLDANVAELRGDGHDAIAMTVDVTRRDEVAAMVGAAVREFGRLDVIVNNAGISPISPIADLDIDGWEAMIDVNLRGVLNGIAAALPVFRSQERGHVVTIVSTAGLKITRTMAVYAATKNAVRTVHEGLRAESTDGWLRTTAISPGYVRTELAGSISDPKVRGEIQSGMDSFALDPDAVARAVAFAIDQPDEVEVGELVIRPTRQG